MDHTKQDRNWTVLRGRDLLFDLPVDLLNDGCLRVVLDRTTAYWASENHWGIGPKKRIQDGSPGLLSRSKRLNLSLCESERANRDPGSCHVNETALRSPTWSSSSLPSGKAKNQCILSQVEESESEGNQVDELISIRLIRLRLHSHSTYFFATEPDCTVHLLQDHRDKKSPSTRKGKPMPMERKITKSDPYDFKERLAYTSF